MKIGMRQSWDTRTSLRMKPSLLCTPFAPPLHPDAALQAVELSAVGARVRAHLTPENLALPALRFTVSIHALFRRLAVGRDHLCGRSRRARAALHHQQPIAGRARPLGTARRVVARLVVARGARLSGDRPVDPRHSIARDQRPLRVRPKSARDCSQSAATMMAAPSDSLAGLLVVHCDCWRRSSEKRELP